MPLPSSKGKGAYLFTIDCKHRASLLCENRAAISVHNVSLQWNAMSPSVLNMHKYVAKTEANTIKPVVVLGGVRISVLFIGPKIRGFKPGRDNGFSKAIKISNTPSFGEKVKLSAPCCNILRHVQKNHLEG
jgi:hypothetical protein